MVAAVYVRANLDNGRSGSGDNSTVRSLVDVAESLLLCSSATMGSSRPLASSVSLAVARRISCGLPPRACDRVESRAVVGECVVGRRSHDSGFRNRAVWGQGGGEVKETNG